MTRFPGVVDLRISIFILFIIPSRIGYYTVQPFLPHFSTAISVYLVVKSFVSLE